MAVGNAGVMRWTRTKGRKTTAIRLISTNCKPNKNDVFHGQVLRELATKSNAHCVIDSGCPLQ